MGTREKSYGVAEGELDVLDSLDDHQKGLTPAFSK